MDLIRSTIEAVFYHLPINTVIRAVDRRHSLSQKSLLEYITEIVSRNNPEFTWSEIELLDDIILTDWLTDSETNFKALSSSAISADLVLSALPLLLNKFASAVLTCDSLEAPRIKFQHLLRWRELTLMVGEDLLTLPYLARIDCLRRNERRLFCWPNVLEHDNFRLNAILEDQLSDTHCHINATQDVFEFNWIALMNYPEKFLSEFFVLRKNGLRMDYDLTDRPAFGVPLKYDQLIIIAAAIRLFFFRLVNPKILPHQKTKNRLSPFLEASEIKDALTDSRVFSGLFNKMRTTIGIYSSDAMRAEDILVLDYAIRKLDFIEKVDFSVISSPFTIHHGERSIIYKWFRGYYKDEPGFRDTGSLMMLYLLIKTKIRREFVQTNHLKGFLNFQKYQGIKNLWQTAIPNNKENLTDQLRNKVYRNSLFRYAVQSSVGNGRGYFLEARLSPNEIQKFRNSDFDKPIFGRETVKILSDEERSRVTIVAHFLKRSRKDDSKSIPRNSNLRDSLWGEANIIVDSIKTNTDKSIPHVVGIDAASSELACRPEVFAPMFRYIKSNGLSNFTFHAGEDFYDILDGLRTIAETIDFMGYTIGCRIGHGLALGLDSVSFYSKRHRKVILPKQILLDNLVWMKYFALHCNIQLSQATLLLIDENYSRLISELGYSPAENCHVDIWTYWQSMRMRGDFVPHSSKIAEPYIQEVMRSPVSPDRNREQLEKLHQHYENDLQCREIGNRPEILNLPKSFALDVAEVQRGLLNVLEEKGIVIETNPSSNLKIGRFDRYDQHPITLFHNVEADAPRHSMVVTINTDDKGVFATSLQNEYSLIALALQKQRDENGKRLWSDLQIEQYLKRIAHYGNISRFRPI